MRIQVEAKKQYGQVRYYPKSNHACLFADIAGTRTLTSDVLRKIKAMGIEVEIENPDVNPF